MPDVYEIYGYYSESMLVWLDKSFVQDTLSKDGITLVYPMNGSRRTYLTAGVNPENTDRILRHKSSTKTDRIVAEDELLSDCDIVGYYADHKELIDENGIVKE